MAKRKIIIIDEDKCNGCGLCVPSCAEGAIQIIDGKARLVSEVYCDGLGDCLGTCPEDAIHIEEREAEEFDAAAVEKHLKRNKQTAAAGAVRSANGAGVVAVAERGAGAPERAPEAPGAFACPGMALRDLGDRGPAAQSAPKPDAEATGEKSLLQNWPIQLKLVPVNAPWFQDADLVIAADCAPFAFSGFHRRFLAAGEGEHRPLLIGCPKLDDVAMYQEKLRNIFAENEIRSVEVPYLEVPCCYGLVQIVQDALARSGKEIPLKLTKIGIRGDIQG